MHRRTPVHRRTPAFNRTIVELKFTQPVVYFPK